MIELAAIDITQLGSTAIATVGLVAVLFGSYRAVVAFRNNGKTPPPAPPCGEHDVRIDAVERQTKEQWQDLKEMNKTLSAIDERTKIIKDHLIPCLLLAVVLASGCTWTVRPLLAHNSAAAAQGLDAADAKAAQLESAAPSEVPRLVKRLRIELADARERVDLACRWSGPPPSKVKRFTDKDNRMYNALEGVVHGAARRREIFEPIRQAWNLVRWLWRWGPWILASIISAVGGVWIYRQVRFIYAIIVRLLGKTNLDPEEKREITGGTPAQKRFQSMKKRGQVPPLRHANGSPS